MKTAGTVTWGHCTATLNMDGTWSATTRGKPDPDLAESLSAIYSDAYAVPQDGYFGVTILEDLAERVDGTADISPLPPDADHDVVQ